VAISALTLELSGGPGGAAVRRPLERIVMRGSETIMDKYRPSNGTEGEFFMEQFCYRCTKYEWDKGCDIQLRTMFFDVEDDEYPQEWQYDETGKPTCTDFECDGLSA